MDSIDWDALEKEFRAYKPGTQVDYQGSIIAARGIWVVRAEIGDERYTLQHPTNEWERLNADREDLTPVDGV